MFSRAVCKKLPVKLACLFFVGMFVLFVLASLPMIGMKKHVYATTSQAPSFEYGIVFGSGIDRRKQPRGELRSRLDIAAQAMLTGKVKKLLLSGDNRTLQYNEPEAMKTYLIKTYRIDAEKLQEDFAGRSTYETCERARKIFSIRKALLFSTRSHLPRAIYTCRHFGIQSYGMASGVSARNAYYREPLAVLKMYFNLYIYGEKTILGEKIDF
ncbi:hypothetical protein CSA80_00315 [Candidatus Saccharibacteria bacterium]|nr:MAG: hypothetical protein CR973_00630 [Candidatus Saccharibacteria bacterium]PID99613.1 MAG: hypothetical protein CSA80_00315 [Candidatus Saccharibacteria bacterium]